MAIGQFLHLCNRLSVASVTETQTASHIPITTSIVVPGEAAAHQKSTDADSLVRHTSFYSPSSGTSWPKDKKELYSVSPQFNLLINNSNIRISILGDRVII